MGQIRCESQEEKNLCGGVATGAVYTQILESPQETTFVHTTDIHLNILLLRLRTETGQWEVELHPKI